MKVTKTGLGISIALAISTTVVGYFEGRSLTAYLDPVGIPTICEGITADVSLGDVSTHEECDDMLRTELKYFSDVIATKVEVPLKPTQHAALISFVYNVGEGNFASSTLLRKLNSGDYTGACRELPRWVYAKGRKLRGLEIRRQKEMEICLL